MTVAGNEISVQFQWNESSEDFLVCKCTVALCVSCTHSCGRECTSFPFRCRLFVWGRAGDAKARQPAFRPSLSERGLVSELSKHANEGPPIRCEWAYLCTISGNSDRPLQQPARGRGRYNDVQQHEMAVELLEAGPWSVVVTIAKRRNHDRFRVRGP